ncbi:MAG: hypothetical protein WCF85_04020 [Rhodospirillaceae bacterium]
MTLEKETELTGKIDALIMLVREQNALIRHHGEQIAELRAEFDEFRIEVRTAQAVTNARLNDQNQIMAALIPAKLAAVGGR